MQPLDTKLIRSNLAECGFRLAAKFTRFGALCASLLIYGQCLKADPIMNPKSLQSEHPWAGAIQEQISSATYTESDQDFPNPERGFYDWVELISAGNTPVEDLSFVTDGGTTLAFAFVRLDQFSTIPITEEYINSLDAAFGNVRQSGIKLIVRVAYNFPDRLPPQTEASLDQIEAHAEQLRPLFLKNADVISVVQAGMIGPWGEWHGSTQELSTPIARNQVLKFVLNMTPEDRFVQLRSPAHLIELSPEQGESDTTFQSIAGARLGHHNDCFLSSADDVGTYHPRSRQDEYRKYLDQLSKAAPFGGETCQYKPEAHRTSCVETLAELERFRWSFLNKRFYLPDHERWKKEGCYSEISKRLGYRFVLNRAQIYSSSLPGRPILFSIEISNVGFARPYNLRPAFLILRSVDGEITRIDLSLREHQIVALTHSTRGPTSPDRVDMREMLPAGGEKKTLTFAPVLPTNMGEGRYDLFLHFPDASPLIGKRSQYAIRLANVEVWDAPTGWNDLQLSIEIKGSSALSSED